MKQNISAPLGITIAVIVSLVIIGVLYKSFFSEKKITPEQTREMMSKHGGH